MTENWHSVPAKTTHRIRSLLIYVSLLLLAFLIGFVPMWIKSRENAGSLADAQRQLSLARMENSIDSAAIYAQRGDYETARQNASDFFTLLRTEASKGADSALSQAQQDGSQLLLAQRDVIITMLARGDGASANTLSDLDVAYHKLVES
jgi:vacuolar-type H+-ATPase subunit H